ncbi:trichohyalin-like [Ptychodera flava]|uniref:trichohyalin-like n=1 Tax=Ptychodera flava TaxID=63121 RepID=UPI00396A30B3
MATRARWQERRTTQIKTPAQMGNRTLKVIPVGAWVEPTSSYAAEEHHAVYAAQIEEERIQRAQAEKEAKLRKFQQEVRKRVTKLQKIKQQQQLENSFRAVEMERKVLQQSSHAAERMTPKKNNCVFREEDQHLIRLPASTATASREETDDAECGRALDEHSHHVHRAIRQAKRNLAAKKMVVDQNLPGGTWKVSPTRDLPTARQELDTDERIEAGSLESDVEIPQQPIDEPALSDEEEHVARQPDPLNREEVYQQAGVSAPKVVTFSPSVGRPHEMRDFLAEREPAAVESEPKVVTFDSDKEPDEVLPRQRRKRTPRLCTKTVILDVKPGIQEEENKRQTRSQFSMYRRMFMDIEREQVKENIRKREHRKKILRLKREKELERRKEEMKAEMAVETRDPVTGETAKEALEKSKQEEKFMKETLEKYKKKKQKQKETDRYIDALRAMMKDKIEKQNIQLPPLCNCGPTIWDSNPDTCANNCVFYRNPTAYAKALQSVLMSCDVV